MRMSIKCFAVIFVAFAFFLGQISRAEACIPDGGRCHESDPGPGCCSGFCYRERNWKDGDCRKRP
uniref:Salivary gland antimicrobial peptide 1 n=1 Tax=Pseudolycoriella hygida TaxID=35572 RepID=Q3LTD6_9DIPT|nr:salivary gland antimicrobial peptide 1 [Pseudolycoriella hygida]ACX48922.1 salivary gland antimicrobial peptide 1 [synthetic construct]